MLTQWMWGSASIALMTPFSRVSASSQVLKPPQNRIAKSSGEIPVTSPSGDSGGQSR